MKYLASKNVEKIGLTFSGPVRTLVGDSRLMIYKSHLLRVIRNISIHFNYNFQLNELLVFQLFRGGREGTFKKVGMG